MYYVILSNIQFPTNYKNIAAIYHSPVPVYISHYTCKHLKRRKLETMLSKKSFAERAIYFSLSDAILFANATFGEDSSSLSPKRSERELKMYLKERLGLDRYAVARAV